MHILKIKILDDCPNKEFVKKFYQDRMNMALQRKDFGVDIIFPDDELFLTNKVIKCGMGIICNFFPNGGTESGPFDLIPKSSMANTPLMLTNSVEILDPEPYDELVAAFRCNIDRDHKSTIDDFKYIVEKGTNLLQIVAPDRKIIRVEVVETIYGE